MKITLSQLRRIIKEETERALSEAEGMPPMEPSDEDEGDRWYSEAMDYINQELGLGPNQAPIKVDFEFAQGAWVAGSDVAEQFGEIRVTKGTIEGRTAMQLAVDAGDWSFYV